MIEKLTVVLSGIKINEDELRKLGFDGHFDEKLIPIIERHVGVDLRLYRGEGSPDIFIGITVADSDRYDHQTIKLKFPDHKEVSNDLNKLGFSVEKEDIDHWFFDVYN